MLPITVLSFLFLSFAAFTLAATDFYKILNLDKSCSDRDLKRAYRTLSKKYHPDKSSGDEQKFLEVAEAYEALSDPTTRKIYDQHGHEGLAQHKQRSGSGRGQGHDPFDLFRNFFGGGGGGGHGGVRRGPDMEVQLRIPLRDFYNGRDINFSIEKQQLCDTCHGSGSADGVVETCGRCGGRGMLVQKHQLAPGIFQQMQSHCDVCGGQGKTIKHKCQTCGGHKVIRKAVELVAEVEKGMRRGERIIFEGEADENPDWEAGNLIVVLQELDPAIGSEDRDNAQSESGPTRTDGTFFRRKDLDLYWKEVLSLREAWMGDWTRNLTHLDGHTVHLSRPRGQVVQPGHVDTVDGEGMPVHESFKSEHSHGRLFVEYAVVLPDQLDASTEKEFWALWEKQRKKSGVKLGDDSGRQPFSAASAKSEL